jgi:hypothetical protein
MNDNGHEDPAETSQEGMTPVQAFSSPAIPPSSGVPLEMRRGRPRRGQMEQGQDAQKPADGQPTGDKAG